MSESPVENVSLLVRLAKIHPLAKAALGLVAVALSLAVSLQLLKGLSIRDMFPVLGGGIVLLTLVTLVSIGTGSTAPTRTLQATVLLWGIVLFAVTLLVLTLTAAMLDWPPNVSRMLFPRPDEKSISPPPAQTEEHQEVPPPENAARTARNMTRPTVPTTPGGSAAPVPVPPTRATPAPGPLDPSTRPMPAPPPRIEPQPSLAMFAGRWTPEANGSCQYATTISVNGSKLILDAGLQHRIYDQVAWRNGHWLGSSGNTTVEFWIDQGELRSSISEEAFRRCARNQ